MPDTPRATVVVVGGGISGLSAAWAVLQQRPGTRVVVLEASPSVGGKLALLSVGGVSVDAGAEALLARRPEAVDLAHEVGLGDDLVTPSTITAGVWSRGRVAPLPRGSLMGIPAHSQDAVGVLTAGEAAAIDVEPDLAAQPLHADVDVASYVASRVGRPVVDRLVEPLLGGVYAGHADRLSLQATVPAVWAAATRGTSLVETARSAAPPTAGDGVPVPVFAGIRGGVGRLPEAVRAAVERAGGQVRTGVTVRRLARRPSQWPGAGVSWELGVGSRADEELVSADAVILAVPARPAARLLGGVVPLAAADLASVESASMALVVAVLPDAAGLVPTGSSGFLVPPVDGRVVKAATYSSAKWGWLAQAAGRDLVVRLSIGRLGEEALLQRPDDELVALALADLASALGAALPHPVDRAVVRWGGGLPQYSVGHVDRMAGLRAAVAQVPGLAVAGAYLDGLGVPACIASARLAAGEVLADLAHSRHLGAGSGAVGPTMGA
jgi:oxygen-dependent protoporphyrinogen oxidase